MNMKIKAFNLKSMNIKAMKEDTFKKIDLRNKNLSESEFEGGLSCH